MRTIRLFLRIFLLAFLLNPITGHGQVFGVLGVQMQPCPTRCGIIITDIVPGSPAHFAGLQVGDIIQQLNGVNVFDDIPGVSNYIVTNPGQIVHITISRFGFLLGGYVKLDAATNLGLSVPAKPAGTTVYPTANPTGPITINVFGNIEGQHNETNQTGTGNISTQSNSADPSKQQQVPIRGDTSPSFDCFKARTHAERLICSSSELAEADTRMVRAYKNALRVFSDPDLLTNEQLAWIREVRDTCSNVPCMLDAYNRRTREIIELTKP